VHYCHGSSDPQSAGATVAAGNTIVTANDKGQYVAEVSTRGVLRVQATVYPDGDDEECDADAPGLAEIAVSGKHEYRADIELSRECLVSSAFLVNCILHPPRCACFPRSARNGDEPRYGAQA
jgi:hypothetical protein